MSLQIKIALLSLTLLSFAIHTCKQDTHVAEKEETVTPEEPITSTATTEVTTFENCSKITRQVLITHCGSCHQSTLSTAKKGALAVFDLDKNVLWHVDLSAHDLPGISNRLLNDSEITTDQKEAIALFVELKGKALED